MWLWLYYLPSRLLYTSCDEAIPTALCFFAAASFEVSFYLQLKDFFGFYLVHPLCACRFYLVAVGGMLSVNRRNLITCYVT